MKISTSMTPAQAINVAQWHDDKAAAAYQRREFDVYERHVKILLLLRNRDQVMNDEQFCSCGILFSHCGYPGCAAGAHDGYDQPTLTQRILSAERSERSERGD